LKTAFQMILKKLYRPNILKPIFLNEGNVAKFSKNIMDLQNVVH
jgi:hypothetical protein